MTERRQQDDWLSIRHRFAGDLDPALPQEEREDLLELAVELTDRRPIPSPGVRSAIRSRLLARDSSSTSRVGALIFGYASSGTLLLIVAAAGLVGFGPFAN
jgi:hypothetical protein